MAGADLLTGFSHLVERVRLMELSDQLRVLAPKVWRPEEDIFDSIAAAEITAGVLSTFGLGDPTQGSNTVVLDALAQHLVETEGAPSFSNTMAGHLEEGARLMANEGLARELYRIRVELGIYPHPRFYFSGFKDRKIMAARGIDSNLWSEVKGQNSAKYVTWMARDPGVLVSTIGYRPPGQNIGITSDGFPWTSEATWYDDPTSGSWVLTEDGGPTYRLPGSDTAYYLWPPFPPEGQTADQVACGIPEHIPTAPRHGSLVYRWFQDKQYPCVAHPFGDYAQEGSGGALEQTGWNLTDVWILTRPEPLTDQEDAGGNVNIVGPTSPAPAGGDWAGFKAHLTAWLANSDYVLPWYLDRIADWHNQKLTAGRQDWVRLAVADPWRGEVYARITPAGRIHFRGHVGTPNLPPVNVPCVILPRDVRLAVDTGAVNRAGIPVQHETGPMGLVVRWQPEAERYRLHLDINPNFVMDGPNLSKTVRLDGASLPIDPSYY